ncbi:citryl-CoA lyase [Mycolicibacterium anyangense]|uniref:Citryl-CoA lyase n=1 Tax=Mycolicibacterium anyangense TaxID=1431246 RepID=A0A6N4W510_9MYCO|nr:citryl-CoA lyase [Mycolicibacterium anyangense]
MLDLEDAVAPGHKETARAAVAEFLGAAATPVVVRINGTDTPWCADDLAAVCGHDCAVMVPKAHSAAQLTEVAAALGPDTPLIALIETAAGVHACASVCNVDAVVRAAFGSIDLAAELGVDPDAADALQHARSAVVLGSAVAGCAAPLDGVTTDISGDTALLADVAHAVRLGFGGKLCIHPAQVAGVNEGFAPSAAEVLWAGRVLAAAADGEVCVVDGRMVDKPVVDRARRIASRSPNRTVG